MPHEPIYESLQEQFDQGELTRFSVGQFLSKLNDYNLGQLFTGAHSVLERGREATGDLEQQVIDIAKLVFRVEQPKMSVPTPETDVFWQFVFVFCLFIMLEHCRRQGLVEFSQITAITNQFMRIHWLPESEGNPLREFIVRHTAKLVTVAAEVRKDNWLTELADMINKKHYLPQYSLSVYLTLVSDETLDEMVEAAKDTLKQVKERENGKQPRPSLATVRLSAMTNLLLLMERGQAINGSISHAVNTEKLVRLCATLMMEWLSRQKQLKFHGGLYLDGGQFQVEMTEQGRAFLNEHLTSLHLKCFDFSIEEEKRA